METDNTKHIIDAHLKQIRKTEKSKIGVLSLSLGIVAIGALGIMGIQKSKPVEISQMDTSIELILEDEGKVALVSDIEEVEMLDIVATISPTSKQLDKLKENEEAREVINENKKRNEKRKPQVKKEEADEISLTQEEILLLEDADILGADGEIFKENDLIRVSDVMLPVPFNNKVGISTRTYSADEVKELHTVHTGIVIKE